MYRECLKICITLLLYLLVCCDSENNQSISVCLYKSYNKKNCSIYKSFEEFRENVTDGNYVLLEAVGNNLQTVPKGFLTNIHHIQEIWLSKNNISKIIPGAFQNVSYASLSLSDNEIERIEKGIFSNLTQIFSISLTKNLINFIDQDAFTNMTNLREINLSFNRLKTWNSKWLIGTQIIHLDVSHNAIEHLPNASFQFAETHKKTVHKISFKNNRIKSLSNDTLVGLPKVNYLYFSMNQIFEIGESFMKNTSATYLDLNWNKIENLPEKLEHVLTAQCTSLKYNPMTCLSYRRLLKWQEKSGKCIYHNFQRYCSSEEIE